MSNIFFNYLLLITRGSPLSLLNKPNIKLIRRNRIYFRGSTDCFKHRQDLRTLPGLYDLSGAA